MSGLARDVGPEGPRMVGRYYVGAPLAAGGMATVHAGRVVGPSGFSRVVAIKRMLPHLAQTSSFALMFADEARLAARVRHPNVVPTFDVVMEGGELCIVMEYVKGSTLSELTRLAAARNERIPTGVALAIVRDALQGLHAAHEAVDDDGRPLGIVHRDVSPQNILVGTDGIARVLDFGIARANVRLHETREGDGLKGKLRYIAPEQFEGRPAERASDVYSSAVVLWEALTGRALHDVDSEAAIVKRVLAGDALPPSEVEPSLGRACDVVVMRGLAREPRARFATACEMAIAVAESGPVAPAARVGQWVQRIAGDVLARRDVEVRTLEGLPLDVGSGANADPDATRPEISASAATAAGASGAIERSASASPAETDLSPPRRRVRAVLLAVVGASVVLLAATAALHGRKTMPVPESTTAAVTRPVLAPTPEPPSPAPSSAPTNAPERQPPAPPAARATPRPRLPHRATSPTLPDHL